MANAGLYDDITIKPKMNVSNRSSDIKMTAENMMSKKDSIKTYMTSNLLNNSLPSQIMSKNPLNGSATSARNWMGLPKPPTNPLTNF